MFVPHPKRPWRYLAELADLWRMTPYDIAFLVETGQLRVSVARDNVVVCKGEILPDTEEHFDDNMRNGGKGYACPLYPAEFDDAFIGQRIQPYMEDYDNGVWPLHCHDAQQIIKNGEAMAWIIHNQDVESIEEHGFKGHCTYFEYPGVLVKRDQLIVTTKQQQVYEDAHGIPGSMATVVKRQATLAVLNATSRFLNRLSK